MPAASSVRLAAATIVAVLALAPVSVARQKPLGPGDVNALPSKPADARITYGPAPEQFGDLRLPSGTGPFPLAIVIHGGCFTTIATLQNSTAMADALRDAGLATWNIEYRRIGDQGGGWPGTFQDVGLAADYVRTLMDRYPIDRNRVVAVGHSTGAFLALWLAARERVPVDSPLFVRDPFRFRTAVAVGGDGNLLPRAPASEPIAPAPTRSVEEATRVRELEKRCEYPVADIFFEKPPNPARLAQANPVDMLPFATPQLAISGGLDPFEPRDQISAYVARVTKSGGTIEELTIDDAGHFELVAPTSKAWPLVRKAILRAAGIAGK